MTKPLITGTTHILPFEKLSPDDFERLCLWLVERDRYTGAEHLGASGSEQGRDIIAWREGALWAFQCKRVKSFGPKDALEEIEKVLGLPEAERPAGLMFFVTCNVSADTREQAGARCAQAGVTCEFCASTELDAKVKRHPEIVKEFFQIAPPTEGPSRIPFVLPQLDVSTFIGRDEEMMRLEELLLTREGPKVCSIVGLVGVGGIGKSALTCHFAELHKADFPDGVIGLRVNGKDVDTIAREFALCCGEEIDPDDKRDASTIMQDVFGHRWALLIFDNADDAAIRSLRPGGDRCAVIVTTRDRLLPASLDIPVEGRIDLPPLPDPDSLRLLERLLSRERVAAEWKAACEIIELVGNLPLALQIVGAALQMQPWCSLADYVASLTLTKLKIRGDEHLDVRASFSLSLELLEPQEIDFFACLSVCAEDGFSVQAAMAAGDCDEATAHERLGYLYRLSLLNRPQFGANRFVFHPLIRLFAQELAVKRSLQDGAAERHARFFVEFVKSSDVNDRIPASALAEELDDIILAAEWLQRQERADHEFLIRLQPFFEQHGHWRQAVNLTSGFLPLAERIEDWNAVVQLRIQQARYLSLRGEWTQAQEALAPIADILGRIETQAVRQRCEAMGLNTLGGVLRAQGHFDEAVDTFQRSYTIFEQLGDQHDLAMVLNSLGSVLRRQGRFDEALDAFQRSCAIAEELGDQRGVAMVLNSLGGVLQDQGHFDEALAGQCAAGSGALRRGSGRLTAQL
jgi:tetratricopeptide (TPR) repeat protein